MQFTAAAMRSRIADRDTAAAFYSVDHLPDSDGKPMGETSRHVLLIVETLDALRAYFRDDPHMFIIGNFFVYFLDAAGVLKRLAPDIFAVRGVGQEERRVYAVEREGKAPEFVIEFTSKKTKKSDFVNKKGLYAWLGVQEYFLFDPFGEYLKPRLMGFRLLGGKYNTITCQGEELRLHSEYLNLDLVAEGGRLRFWNASAGDFLLTHQELEDQRRVEAEAYAREAQARRAAESEVARLREELSRFRQNKE
ncbi:MAG: Uma2 family endonuclease [bacterium]